MLLVALYPGAAGGGKLRVIESLPPAQYETLSYYEKWTAALKILLIEKGILTATELRGAGVVIESAGYRKTGDYPMGWRATSIRSPEAL